MKSWISHAALCTLALTFLGGCAAMKSVRHNPGTTPPGIGYYLPNGDVRITLTIDAQQSASFVVDTLYYPDITEHYSVRAPKNWVADTTISVKTDAAGLLNTTSYRYEPKFVVAAESLALSAKSAGNRSGPNLTGPCPAGTYVARFPVKAGAFNASKVVCGYEIVVTHATSDAKSVPTETQEDQRGNSDRSNGLYFRMNLPYLVEIFSLTSRERVFSGIALSPTGAKRMFASTSRGLFSTMSGNLVFSNGVLVEFSPNHTSEIETAAKLPAAILKSYFDSVNALFVLRKGSADREADYAAAIENLNRARASLEACEAAQASEDKDEIAIHCKPLNAGK